MENDKNYGATRPFPLLLLLLVPTLGLGNIVQLS